MEHWPNLGVFAVQQPRQDIRGAIVELWILRVQRKRKNAKNPKKFNNGGCIPEMQAFLSFNSNLKNVGLVNSPMDVDSFTYVFNFKIPS